MNKNHERKVVIGMQGSGKTELVKQLTKQYKKPLVYGVYPEEWKKESNKITIFEPNNFNAETFNNFAFQLIGIQKDKPQYDVLVVDDADLFFTSNFQTYESINRLFISMRQLNISLIIVSKRPQNLSTKVYENADEIYTFAIEGVNVKKYLNNLHEEMSNLLPKLSREKHNFILKKIGSKPRLFQAVAIK